MKSEFSSRKSFGSVLWDLAKIAIDAKGLRQGIPMDGFI